ncbi:MAG: STAS domain-containing protein [Pedococcus sp.]
MNPNAGPLPFWAKQGDPHRPSWMLRADHHDLGTVWVLALSGESDLASRDVLTQELYAAEGRQRERLVLDLSRLSFCDAASVQLFLGAARRSWVGRTGATVCVSRVFELMDPYGAVHAVSPPGVYV